MNIVTEFGRINGACSKANVSYQILKYPNEDMYHILLTPISGDVGAHSFSMWFIDDVIDNIVEEVQKHYD